MRLKLTNLLKVSIWILLIMIITVFSTSADLSAEKKEKKGNKNKKEWLPGNLIKVDLTEDQIKKIKALDSCKELIKIKQDLDSKNIKISSDEGKKIKKEAGWQELMKKFKKDTDGFLTDKQKQKIKEIVEEYKKKNKNKKNK